MESNRRLARFVQQMILPPDLTGRERHLLKSHLLSACFTGIVVGSLNLADVTLTKTLGASPIQVTILSLLTAVAFLGSLFWVGTMRGRRKAPFIVAAAIGGRLTFWLVGLSNDPRWFLLLVGIAWLAQAIIVTAQVSIIQRAYRRAHRNSLFGLSVSIMTLMNLATSVGMGWLLDWNEGAYGIYYGIAGTAGFVGALLLARMERGLERYRGPAWGAAAPGESDVPPLGAVAYPGAGTYRPMGQPGLGATWRSMRESVQLVVRILKDDPAFRRFQRNFFIYGIAFIALLPVVPIFLVHDLQLDYRQIGLAKGLMGQAGMILFPPLLGRAMERLGPVRHSARMFAFLALYPLFLTAAGLVAGKLQLPLAFIAFGCFGIGMAGISLAWHMSSIHFARNEDPSSYQAVHAVLTGVRGSFAPFLGYLLIQTGSAIHAFLTSAFLLLLAAALMLRMARDGDSHPAGVGAGPPATGGPDGKRD